MEELDFDSFAASLPKKPRENFTARYYGTRSLKVFPPEFYSLLEKYGSFIDITAGGGRLLYYLAKTEKRIGANDRCYYSYVALSSVFKKRYYTDDWLRCRWDSLHPANIGTVKSLPLFEKQLGGLLNPELISYLSGITAPAWGDQVLYAVGKSLRSIFTFRGLGWYKKTSIGVDSIDVTPKKFFQVLMKALWTTRLYNESLPNLKHEVIYHDALAGLDYFSKDLIEGSLVYMDPAWPWAEKFKASSNPYAYFTNELSSLLLQQQQNVTFWKRDSDIIFHDIKSWIDKSFERGAACVVVCNQDTNYPSLESTRAWCETAYPNKTSYIEVMDFSRSMHHIYKTAWVVIRS